MDKDWSIPLPNLSTDDIKFEKAYLKSSSPKRSSACDTEVDTTTDTATESSILMDNEKKDPTYGVVRARKPSHHPGRQPSAAHIAAQKLIVRTKGVKPPKQKPSQSLQQST